MKNFEGLKKEIKAFANSNIIYRKSSYKGKGRPLKIDFIFLKRKDLRDYQCMEMLNSGCKTTYTK